MTENKGKDISRRDFLKKGAQLLGGAFIAGAVPDKFVKEVLKEQDVKFKDIEEDESLIVFVGNSSESIYINIYTALTLDRKPTMRLEGDVFVPKPFVDGVETIRMLAEVTDRKLYKLEINDSLVTDGRVATYRSPVGFLKGDSGGLFPTDREMCGLKVITASCNYFDGTRLPEEKNEKPSFPDYMDSFGEGYLVGELVQENGANILKNTSFVCDARALKTTN